MQSKIRISEAVQGLLRCPICHARVRHVGQAFACVNSECDARFPVVDGIPILLNEESSVFAIGDVISRRGTVFRGGRESRPKKMARRFMRSVGKNTKAKGNFGLFGDLLLGRSACPRVLVIGGGILGRGMETIVDNASLDFVESDVSFGVRTQLICDAHDIPFEDKSFDGVIAQAVLEHVVDPYRCVEEIHRVLDEQGIVYAETPFMQQVHGRQHDFTRFTHLGHRRLFRGFEEITSGAACGPGVALAWSYRFFLLSFTTSRTLRKLIRAFATLTSFYLKYFDYYLIDKPGALDAASVYYFMGRRAGDVLSDRELVQLYRGTG